MTGNLIKRRRTKKKLFCYSDNLTSRIFHLKFELFRAVNQIFRLVRRFKLNCQLLSWYDVYQLREQEREYINLFERVSNIITRHLRQFSLGKTSLLYSTNSESLPRNCYIFKMYHDKSVLIITIIMNVEMDLISSTWKNSYTVTKKSH